ncbi:hypothetical protein [Pseudanabaena sp. PCC 6802]|uniref:hypothetical protein n=1 Tax=Pseudanabaena sp. PCC 6802 TaxID=118173 RepID=UPI000345A45B|nr:hypothetical protein [Pseudanabaena sp. PCC 6802]
MSQKQLDEKELQEILELCQVADRNMKEISRNMTVILEKAQQWATPRQTTISNKD